MPGERVLVVDDEENIVKIVKAYLERDGYRVLTAADGKEALRVAKSERPDLIVLDLMLPEISGWDVCRAVRQDSRVPIIMVTARDEVTDRIVGLELGADDYITKPFDPKELLARVRAVLRRASAASVEERPERIVAGEMEVDLARHEVRVTGRPVSLTPTEFDLLKVMAQSPGRVHTRLELLDRVQGDAYEGYERAIDSHIKNLRQKIEPDPRHPKYILTVFGVGYKFSEAASQPRPQPQAIDTRQARDARSA